MTGKELLKGCWLFDGLSEEQLGLLGTFCGQMQVAEGSVIFREGEPARYLYVVGEGRVGLEMSVQRPDGGLTRPAVVAVLGPGEAFGWSAVVAPHVMTMAARALEPSVVGLLEGKALREVLGCYRDVGYVVMCNLAKLLARRLNQTREALLYERGWAMVG
ncbi:MAG: cyclic nucleotide-binding domain-containing protein [Chloroflexi bacterium]|nr:cyclic nucleotide-binding domain-containing protein [Chloroflexota bacterium]